QQGEADLRRQRHDERRRAVDVATAAVKTATRNVRVLERLRDRAWRRYLEQARHEEMKVLNDLATLQHARRIVESSVAQSRTRQPSEGRRSPAADPTQGGSDRER